MTRLCEKANVLRSARLDLRDGDTDGAVNRSYYAMLNAAQAALLSAGVSEDKLPKTHSGLISAFGQHVVKSGQVGSEFGRSLNKAEGLRLRADYTGVELDRATAEAALIEAERFTQSVERAFGLQPMSAEAAPTEDRTAIQKAATDEKADSLWDKSEGMEERRSRAIQDWLEYRKQQREAARAASRERESDRARDHSGAADRDRNFDDDSA